MGIHCASLSLLKFSYIFLKEGLVNTQQKEQCWRYHNTLLQTILQSHSNKDSMVLAQKQI
jgi:hypothetical protein